MSVQVIDDDGHQVPVGSVGRVRVRGSCVMRGYWNNPTLTTACLDTKGWLTSTDLGRFDALGNLVLVGRTNDMYIRGGYNVYPLEIENLLAEHPAVDRAAVVGVPAAVIGEMGVAFVVPVDFQSPPTLNDVRFWVSQHLADYKMPDRLEIVSELPLTAMMKVDRQVLIELAEGTEGFLQ
jgi:acyl-CoA synthetase (AMP-forming)/AMP-acid ligase II